MITSNIYRWNTFRFDGVSVSGCLCLLAPDRLIGSLFFLYERHPKALQKYLCPLDFFTFVSIAATSLSVFHWDFYVIDQLKVLYATVYGKVLMDNFSEEWHAFIADPFFFSNMQSGSLLGFLSLNSRRVFWVICAAGRWISILFWNPYICPSTMEGSPARGKKHHASEHVEFMLMQYISNSKC